jgi:HK97 family phage prohead protease
MSQAEEARAINPDGYETTKAMKAEAVQALEWRREFNRGGTGVGVARARDISSGKRLPYDTVVRMSSFFARHTVDKKATGFNRGEDGFPSAGRIAWGLWGGDAGEAWAMGIINAADSERAAHSEEVDMGLEFRTAKVELRAVDSTGMSFEGYAALFDSPSAEGTIPEVVKDTAFNRSLAAVDRGEWDVRAYQDHDPKLLLGTTKSGTLSLQKDAKGLKASIRLNPEISFHRDLAAIVKSMGSSLGMSFGFFSTSGNRINEDGVRELKDVKLVEVSALTGLAPYYPGTVSLVSVRGLAAKAGVDSSELRDAVAALLAGEATQDHASILASAIAASSRDVEGVPTTFPGDEPKKDEPEKEEEPVVKEETTKIERSLAEDAGIDPVALQEAADALASGVADEAQLALVISAAKALIEDDAAAEPVDAPVDPNLPVEPVHPDPEEYPATGDEGGSPTTGVLLHVEVKIPRSVPRSTLARALEIEARRVL